MSFCVMSSNPIFGPAIDLTIGAPRQINPPLRCWEPHAAFDRGWLGAVFWSHKRHEPAFPGDRLPSSGPADMLV